MTPRKAQDRQPSGTDRTAAVGARDPEGVARSRIARALYKRSLGQSRASLGAMSLDELLAAVEAKTPAETIVRVISSAPEAGLPLESAWTRALARGAERKQEILGRVGGCLTPADVAERLEITPQAVKQRIDRRTLLAVRLSGNRWGIPARQFGPDGHVRQGMAEVLKAVPQMDGWLLLSVLSEPSPAPGGALLMDGVDDEGTRAGLIARLRTYGEHAAA